MSTTIGGELTEELLLTFIEQHQGVSFKGKVLKWNDEDDVKDVIQKIQDCRNLKFLELEGNTLGVAAAKAIGKALESKPEFEAALWKDLFTGRLKNEIPQAMRFLFAGVDLAGARLQYLDLSDNAIGPLGMTGLAPFFKSDSSFSLKTLICMNNGLGPQGGEEFSKALIDCRKLSISRGGEVFNLRKFVCGRNRMQNKGAMAIAKFIKECDSLEEVQMPENSIYWQAQCALAEAFANNPKLRVINLNDNTITGKGISALAETFKNLSNLREINLGDCLLRSSGAVKIVKALKDLPCIEKIVLEGNEINRPAGIEIAEILFHVKTLKTVNLSSNAFGVEGARFIGELLFPFEDVQIEDVEDSEYEEECEAEEEEEGSEEDDEEPSSEDEKCGEEECEGEEEGEKEECEGEEEGEKEEYEWVEEGEKEEEYEWVEEEEEEYEGERQGEGDDVSMERVFRFLSEPSLDNYNSIPPPGLMGFVYDVSPDLWPHELCFQSAIGMVEHHAKLSSVIPEEVEDVFDYLMGEAMKYTEGLNNRFTTSLLIHLGLFRSEEKKFLRDEISEGLLECLCLWLITTVQDENDLPRSLLACLKTAFNNIRPGFIVDKAKISTMIDYVLYKWREIKRNTHEHKTSTPPKIQPVTVPEGQNPGTGGLRQLWARE